MSPTNQPTLTPIPTSVELYQLRNLATKQKIPSKVELKVISAPGDKVAVLSKRRFWVFDTTSQVTLACAGQFTNGKHAFQYGLNDNKLETQHPVPNKYKISDFSCAALSTVYLAVGCPGRVMTFIVKGDQAGRWVTLNEFEDKDALIEKLTFSTDGKQLVALVRIETGNIHQSKALIFSTDEFPKDQLERKYNKKPTKPTASEVELENWQSYRPRVVAFSSRGTMVAICTNYVQYTARIQLLKKLDSSWSLWGKFHTVQVFPPHDQRDWHGLGITGMSLYVPCL
jgi:hypothetical protein